MSLISEIAQGYQNIGTAKAQGQAASGQIWGQTLANLGQIPAQIQSIKHQQQADALQGMELEGKRREMAAQDALNNAMSTALKPDGSIDLDKISKSLAGTPAAYKFADVAQHVASMQQSHAALMEANQKVAKSEADQIGALAAAADVYDDPHDKAGVLLAGIASGIKGGSISPEHGKAVIASILGPNGTPDPASVNQKIAEMKALSKEQTEIGLQREQKRATAANLAADNLRADQQLAGSEADRVERARHNKAQEASAAYRAQHPASAAQASTSDVKETVAGMKDGSLPPQMPGRASKEYTAIMAEAHRQGYDLAGAVTDWTATQKHITSMNGSQQLRLNQAINQLPDLLDSVDALAAKWKGGRFPVLNRANLALAKNGVYGADVASVANQLDAQIADVTADLGNVYMGGNSPTDHALGLAAKSLSADWDLKVLRDMTALARKNVQIRKNSINSTGVAGASADNPYVPPAAGAPTEGATKPIPGYPGTEQTFKAGKWIRTK